MPLSALKYYPLWMTESVILVIDSMSSEKSVLIELERMHAWGAVLT